MIETARVPPPLAAPSPAPGADEAGLRQAAREFEALTIAELLKPMFEALDVDGLAGGGSGERAFRPMLVDEYARGVVDAGGIGLADQILRELIALQSQSPEETR